MQVLKKIQGFVTIVDTALNTLYTVFSGATQTISDSTVTNSDASYNASILAEGSLILPDITVTNPITGGTYTQPAAKDFTESSYKEIELYFKATYDDNQEYTITSKSAGTYTTETLVNCTVVYEVNSVVVTIPFTVVNTDTLKATITRTNPALDASVTITT